MKEKFLVIKINCKPLVKAYLERNFGDPVAIPPGHVLYKFACSQLTKSNIRPDRFKNYTQDIGLMLCERNFRFDGFAVTPANTSSFNNAIDNYIKTLCRTNLDALLIVQNRHIDWKEKYFQLLKHTSEVHKAMPNLAKELRRLRRELEQHEFDMKTAIETVVFDFLKLDFDFLPYETVKKDYYRYRLKKISTQLSPN